MRGCHCAIALLVFAVLATAPTASAACGPLNQPCQPPAAPAQPLVLTAQENPSGLLELPVRSSTDPLYPAVDGHIPYGLNDNETDRNNAASYDFVGEVTKGIGGTLVRTSLNWWDFEPNDDEWHFDHTDTIYKGFLRHGLRPVITIYGTPRFATNILEQSRCISGTDKCNAEPDQASGPQELFELGFQLARRYPLLAALEYRNEPNIDARTQPAVPAARYATNLAAFYEGVRAGRATTRVWGGALAHNANIPSYVQTVWSHSGVRGKVDALSIHPYDHHATYTHMREYFDWVQAGLNAANEPNVRLVAGEFGVPKEPNGTEYDFSNGDHEPGQERVFDRIAVQWNDLNRLDPGRIAPVPELQRISHLDAAIMFTAVERAPSPDDGFFFGWVERKVGGAPARPNHVWCEWRASIAGLPPWPGSQHVAVCPASWAATG